MTYVQPVLDPLDDFPIHQTPVPLSQNPMGLNAYDRFFFNGYSDDGSIYFGAAMGLYPGRGVIDAAFSVVHQGHQHSVFASGRLPKDRRQTRIGPIQVTIEEPMRRLRVAVDHDLIRGEVVFDRRSQPVEEPRFTNINSGIGLFDVTRYTQFGTWSGGYEVAGESVDVGGTRGCRDRSWGQRPVGPPSGAAPAMPQFFWLWAPTHFDEGMIHFDVNDYADGSRWHDSGFEVPLAHDGDVVDTAPVPMRSVDYELTVAPGTRWLEHGAIVLTPWHGEARRIELEPIMRFQMRGLGYGHPERRHGTWLGEESIGHETITLADVDPTARDMAHVQQLVSAIERSGDGERVGVCAFEVLAIGPHVPTGLTGLFDPKA